MGGKDEEVKDVEEPKDESEQPGAESKPVALGAEQPISPDELPPAAEGGMGAGKEDAIIAAALSAGAEEEQPGLPTEEVAQPAAETRGGLPPFSPEAYQEPTPVVEAPPAPVQKEALAPDPKMVKQFITDDRLDALWVRADTIKIELDDKVHTLDIARTLLDHIMYSRNYLLAGRGFFEEAERHLNEVEFRVFQNFQSRKWSLSIGVPLFIYEIIMAAGLIVTFLALGTDVFKGVSEDVRGIIATMICGGLGGVVGAWLALVKHISRDQDFDKQHSMWYLNSPFMGAGIGMIVYLIMRAGLISMTAGQAQGVASPYVIYILAWLCGYQHNVFTNIVKRMIKVFELGGEAEAKPPEEVAKPPSPPPAPASQPKSPPPPANP